jgi:hypothetical protein
LLLFFQRYADFRSAAFLSKVFGAGFFHFLSFVHLVHHLIAMKMANATIHKVKNGLKENPVLHHQSSAVPLRLLTPTELLKSTPPISSPAVA